MNKKEMVACVSTRLNKSNEEVSEVVEAVIDYIAESLQKGEEVKLHGFGKFLARPYGERKCYNPQTGKEITIPASVQPAFIPSGKFRTRIK